MLPRIVHQRSCRDNGGGAFGPEIPIAGIAGDQQAALAGQACFRPGLTKNTYGTAASRLMHTGHNVPGVEEPAARHRAPRRTGIAVEGSIFVAGAAVQWLRDKLGLLATARNRKLWRARCRIHGRRLCRALHSSAWARRTGRQAPAGSSRA